MSELNKRIFAALENGAEFLVMGEIAANTGLLVSHAPRTITDYDIIVNNIDMSKGCMVEVKHSRSTFKTKIKSTDYDFIVFVYAPSKIENGIVEPSISQKSKDKKGIYVFPKNVVQEAIEGTSGTSFNPENIKVNGVTDKKKYKDFKDAYHLILDMVPNSPKDFKA